MVEKKRAFEFTCSIQVVKPTDGHWGSRDILENGTEIWNGMVGQLSHREADICGASLTMSEERSRVVDFSVGILEDIASIHMIHPSVLGRQVSGGVNLMVYFSVFSSAAWVAIFAMSLTSAFVYAITQLLQSDLKMFSFLAFINSSFLGLHDIFVSIIQRKSETGESTEFLSSKILLISTSAMSYIVYVYYGGDLTATMTAGTISATFKSLQDVLDSEYKFYMLDGSIEYDNFKHAQKGSVRKKLHDGKLEVMYFEDFFNAQEERPTKAVYFGSKFMELENDKFIFLNNFDDRVVSQLAFAFPKSSDLTMLFNYHIKKIIQTGMLRKLKLKWIEGNKPVEQTHRIFSEDAITLGYNNLFFPMLVMLFGIVAGAAVLIVERIISEQKHN